MSLRMTRFLKQTTLLLFTLSSVTLLHAQNTGYSYEQAISSLKSDITTAQQTLDNTQQRVNKERRELATRLSALEQEVEQQRTRTAALRRAEDEKTLSLNKLQSRLEQWQQQSRYQRNQVQHFLQVFSASVNHKERQMTLFSQLETVNSQAIHALQPVWQEQEIATFSGDLIKADTLSIGPLHWYLLNTPDTGSGLLTTDADVPRMHYAFDSAATAELLALKNIGQGSIALDPTQDRAIRLNQQQENILEHLTKGGLWVIPIVCFALVSLLVALAKCWQLWRLPATDNSMMKAIHQQQQAHSDNALLHSKMLQLHAGLKGCQAELLGIALQSTPGQLRDDLLINRLNRQRQTLERWLSSIAVIAAIAPLLGLLGTVSGMIETFKLMTLFGAGDAQAVSGGISKALITTELGLIVAIPSLLLHAVLSRRVKHYCDALEADAIQLSQLDTGETQ